MKHFTLIVCLLITLLFAKGQVYLEPYTGLQMDLNNTDPHYKQINTGLQLSFKSKGSYEPALQLQHSWPFTYNSSDSAFTANPSLPLYANASKRIQPSSSSFATMHRFAVAGKNTAYTFYIVLSAGLVYQKMKVSYAYDKTNYSVLNPDKTFDRFNIYGGFGVLCMHTLAKGRFFTEIDFNTPPAGPKIKYPSSYKFMAPAALNVGYAIKLKGK